MSKNHAKLLVAVRFKPGTSRCSDPTHHFDFFSFALMFNSSIRLSNLQSDMVRYKLEHSGRTRWRGFSLCPTISFRVKAVPPTMPEPLDGSAFVGFADLIQRSKARLNAFFSILIS